jgi:hypothetical protein
VVLEEVLGRWLMLGRRCLHEGCISQSTILKTSHVRKANAFILCIESSVSAIHLSQPKGTRNRSR